MVLNGNALFLIMSGRNDANVVVEGEFLRVLQEL